MNRKKNKTMKSKNMKMIKKMQQNNNSNSNKMMMKAWKKLKIILILKNIEDHKVWHNLTIQFFQDTIPNNKIVLQDKT